MTFNQLKAFIEVAHHSSITVAANKLYISQPTLTRQIQNMEQELAFPLFIRKGSNLKLTKAGENFLASAEQLCLEYEQACQSAGMIANGIKGILHISILDDQLVDEVFNQCIQAFHKKYPEVFIQFEWANFDEIHQGLMEGKTDLAITQKHNEISHPAIRFLNTITEEPCIAITRDFEFPPDTPYSADWLPKLSRQYPFIALRPKRFEQGSTLTNLVPYGISVENMDDCVSAIYTDSPSQRELYVSTGLGFAVVSRHTKMLLNPMIKSIPLPGFRPLQRCLCYNGEISTGTVRDTFIKFYNEFSQADI